MNRNKRIIRSLIGRAKNVSDRNFVLILSGIIGFLAGLAAALLKTTVLSLKAWLLSYDGSSEEIIIYLVAPLVGILLTILFLKFIVRDSVGHGVPRILYAISKLDGSMPVSSYLYNPPDDGKVPIDHDVQEIINKFNRTGSYNFVVLKVNKYIGIVSRANVLKAYRDNIITQLDEH